MSKEELENELADVMAAIKAIRGGAQEYRIGSRMVRKVDYASLLKERDGLIADIAAFDCAGGRTLIGWPGR